MKLRQLVEHLPTRETHGSLDVVVAGLSADSRRVRKGDLFVAVPGLRHDGHQYVPEALRQGAVAVIAERRLDLDGSVPQVIVPNSRVALSLAAAAFHGFPARKLRVVGVTGTDGKTTTAILLGSILEAAGYRVGIITTVYAKIGHRTVDTGAHTTTPEPLEVQAYLTDMVAAGAHYAILETTSHALDQNRTLGCEYDVAVITNVTREHLDYHGTYESYLATKSKLYASLASYRKPGVPKVSVTNADDPSFDLLRQYPADIFQSYGIENPADVFAQEVLLLLQGTKLKIRTPTTSFWVESPLLGRFNAYNLLAASTAALSQGVAPERIQQGVAQVEAIPGRMERIESGQGFSVIIDFAHTPAALQEALVLARTLTRGRLIVVFGCAGQRDRAKRPVMGEIASRLADLVILTAEDPRSEEVEVIMAEIEAGCQRVGRDNYRKIADRREAITFALRAAQRGDLVIITGKGHETTMCFGETEYPWSDREAVLESLAAGSVEAARQREVGR